RAPLQVADFDYGLSLDKHLKKLYLEGKGGGQKMETYELAAQYFNKKCDLPNASMPFFFFIGDEAPYPYLPANIAKSTIGTRQKNNLESRVIFGDLYDKFQGNVFFLQNPYCGDRHAETAEIREEWISYIGNDNAEKIIPIIEEKSVVDVILGTIAMVSRARDMKQYKADMKKRGQTKTRVGNVGKSLEGLDKLYTKGGDDGSVKTKKSGAKKI
ncbi:hypothetical protein COV93_01880, partial [Candidatus Woesearchaeota archaeon CG11_big_fil_rev_8_21_14_0_20_43_8]